MDGVLHRIGKAGRVQRDTENSQPVRIDSSGRLLFYLHNASSAAAHVPLLCDVLDGYLELHPELGDTFGIAGSVFAHYAARLQELAHRWGVRLLATDERAGRYRSYEDAVRRVDDGEFDRLVVCAPPIGVSYLSGRLAPRHLAWFTMKFELNCFEHLAHRASIISSLKTPSAARQPKRWLQAPPFLTRPVALAPSSVLPAPIALARQQHQAVLYTINREQKIRNPDFLATVAETLDRVPGACFVWTGRERLEEIDTFFQARGLLERIYFAGWVNPDDLLAVGDVFLDTPVLSGTIAARAAAAGCALVTFAQSQSWINVYARIHEGDLSTGRSTWEPPADPETRTSGSTPQFEFATRAEYVAAAVRLAVDPAFRARYGRALRDFAEHYFFDKARWAELHLAHLQDGL
jgi:glycosyltransferase involved in cell wall biosynthesis